MWQCLQFATLAGLVRQNDANSLVEGLAHRAEACQDVLREVRTNKDSKRCECDGLEHMSLFSTLVTPSQLPDSNGIKVG